MRQHRFVLVTETGDVTIPELYKLAAALERDGKRCADAWNRQPPTVDVVDKLTKVSGLYHPIRFFSGRDEDAGALGYHYWDPIRKGPAAVVHVDRCSGFNTGTYSVAEVASHEVNEANVNPDLTLWLPHPDPTRLGVEVAGEVGDPTQATYDLDHNGTRWKMTSFILPSWFNGGSPAGTKYDHAGRLQYPGQIGPEGYAILRELRDGRWHIWYEGPSGQRFGSAPVRNAAEKFHKSLSSARGRLLIERAMRDQPEPDDDVA